MFAQHNSPLKQEEVDIIVALCEKVSQNTGGITAADLIGWQSKVDTLDKIPHLSNFVLTETSTEGGQTRDSLQKMIEDNGVFFTKCINIYMYKQWKASCQLWNI